MPDPVTDADLERIEADLALDGIDGIAKADKLAFDDLPRVVADNRRLRAALARVPKTADNVPCYPGMTVFRKQDGADPDVGEGDGLAVCQVGGYPFAERDRTPVRLIVDGIGEIACDQCYSTLAAAKAAKEPDDD